MKFTVTTSVKEFPWDAEPLHFNPVEVEAESAEEAAERYGLIGVKEELP
jgi:hypothetical protein